MIHQDLWTFFAVSGVPVVEFWLGPCAPVEQIGHRMSRARYDLEDRLIRFGAAVCRLTEQFPATALGRQVAAQAIRSGTSPFANYGEVQGAESRRDFIHKLGICLKELRETRA